EQAPCRVPDLANGAVEDEDQEHGRDDAEDPEPRDHERARPLAGAARDLLERALDDPPDQDRHGESAEREEDRGGQRVQETERVEVRGGPQTDERDDGSSQDGCFLPRHLPLVDDRGCDDLEERDCRRDRADEEGEEEEGAHDAPDRAHAHERAGERDEEAPDRTLAHRALEAEGEDDREDEEASHERDAEVRESNDGRLAWKALLLREIAREGQDGAHPEREREERLPRRLGERVEREEVADVGRQVETIPLSAPDRK